MKFNFYASFRSIANTRSLTLDLPAGTTVRQALEAIMEEIPDLRKPWINNKGEVYGHVHVIINGDEVNTLPDKWNTALNPEDTLLFVPPVGGG